MHLQIKNLGQIKQADVHVNDLTIICGPNGSNKTWLSYAIYHYLAFPKISHGFATADVSKDKEALEKKGEVNVYSPFNDDENIDLSSEQFFNLAKEHFSVYEKKCPSEIAKTFNVAESIFDHFEICQSETDSMQTQASINAQILQQYMINSSIKIAHKGVELITEPNDTIVKISHQESELPVKTLSSMLTALLRQLIRELSLSHRPFAITSERVGCLAFQKDIDGTALRIKDTIDEIMEEQQFSDNLQLQQIIARLQTQTFGNRSNLATPVRANLRAVRDAEQEFKKQSFLQQNNPEINQALREITQGSFSSDNGVLQYQFANQSNESQQVPMTVASSSIKSLFHLDLYINHLAKQGDVLLIDEPELNLHPDNQRKMAKVLARLANAGIKVLITTHSDYLIREINNSIMLTHDVDDKQAIMEQNHIKEFDLLNASQVSAYSIDTQGQFSSLEINQMGINTQIFDTIINESNELQNEIYYNLNGG